MMQKKEPHVQINKKNRFLTTEGLERLNVNLFCNESDEWSRSRMQGAPVIEASPVKGPWRNPALWPEDSAESVQASGVQAPVDGVEEQVGQREGQAGVRVDHVAVADQQVHVFSHRSLPAEASSPCGPDVGGLGWSGERVRGQGGCHLGERGQLHVIVVEAAVEGHRLAGVEGGWDLKR